MDKVIKKIVIVGGGSAGWITAGTIAAQYAKQPNSLFEITLIESPQVSSIGVGEGTWPSIRNTLERIGINESAFLQCCDASFKQGSKFIGWNNGRKDDYYYHPFMTPKGYGHVDLYSHWQTYHKEQAFADAINIQSHVCQAGLAPKQLSTPDYAAVTNYGYHLDAKKFAALLKEHCINTLGVKHLYDHIDSIESDNTGDIHKLQTKEHGCIHGDLFVDCTGHLSLLLGKHFEIPLINKENILFNNSALAVQVPYESLNENIASATLSTAQEAGWIWDIGLTSRRGVGYTYSDKYITDEKAEQALRRYLKCSISDELSQSLAVKKISFTPGYREKFWHKNCVAIGMSSGFIEPLEASALAMIELSSSMLGEELPTTRAHMDIIAKRYNKRFTYRWERVIEFLKLHYVLSQRTDSNYWLENKKDSSIPERLKSLLSLWQYQSPSRYDFIQNEEIFPSASYQYILYGMGFKTQQRVTPSSRQNTPALAKLFDEVKTQQAQYLAALPANRTLLSQLSSK